MIGLAALGGVVGSGTALVLLAFGWTLVGELDIFNFASIAASLRSISFTSPAKLSRATACTSAALATFAFAIAFCMLVFLLWVFLVKLGQPELAVLDRAPGCAEQRHKLRLFFKQLLQTLLNGLPCY
jgi:hypothetical protein